MQGLMEIIARNLHVAAEARTKTGEPLVLTSLERAYLTKHRPIEALSLPWLDAVPDGWCCVAEKVIEAGDWPELLTGIGEDQGLAFLQSSALWWRIGIYERVEVPSKSVQRRFAAQGRKPRTGKDVFIPMEAEPGDTFVSRKAEPYPPVSIEVLEALRAIHAILASIIYDTEAASAVEGVYREDT